MTAQGSKSLRSAPGTTDAARLTPEPAPAPAERFTFWLGTHRPAWLRYVTVPLMVSRNTLAGWRRPPRAVGPWVLDSGGFTELQRHGRWTIGAAAYAADVERYATNVGGLVWAAPQDWMCEPFMVAKTGLTVREHQARTVGNFVELRARTPLVIPVLQGFTLADYHACVDRYTAAGVDLAAEPVVGLGSVCRRQATAEIGEIVAALAGRGLALHGFGCKESALRAYGGLMASADSMAWSYGGRKRGTCPGGQCANHLHWAMAWRANVLGAGMGATIQQALPL